MQEVFELDGRQERAKEAVLATLAEGCGVKATYDGNDAEACPCDGVAGIISLVGDVDWSLMLILPQESASRIARQFTGFDIDFSSADMTDVVGELANVLAGDVISRLERVAVKASMGLPMVVRGHELSMMLPDGHPRIHMRFLSSHGNFFFILGSRKST